MAAEGLATESLGSREGVAGVRWRCNGIFVASIIYMLKKGSTGEVGEKIAAKYLQGKGYDILATDYHSGKYGEIDIVAEKDGRLFFVEVRTKTSDLFGTAEESMTQRKKQLHLKRAVNYYLLSNKISSEEYQIDFIAIYLNKWSRKAQIKHYPNISI